MTDIIWAGYVAAYMPCVRSLYLTGVVPISVKDRVQAMVYGAKYPTPGSLGRTAGRYNHYDYATG